MRVSRLVVAAALAGLSTPAWAQSNSDSAAVAALAHAFHAALAAGDSVAALQLLTPDVLILESGALETLADYRAHHLPADIGFASAVSSARTVARIIVRGDAAWLVGISQASGTFRERAVNSAGVELMVFTREPAGWRIRAIHWSSRARRAPAAGP